MPLWAVEIIKSNYDALIAAPLVFAFLLGVGAFAGYLFSNLIHKGKIDGLEERIKLKTEQIEVKDKTIQSMSSDRTNLERAALLSAAPSKSAPPPQLTRADPRFATANAGITKKTEEQLQKLLLEDVFTFVFNPTSGGSKDLTFLRTGEIGDGRNKNENRWRIVDGRLEILDSQGNVYSRFVLLDDGESLHHTNDPDTLSLKGQYIKRKPRFIRRDGDTGRFIDRR